MSKTQILRKLALEVGTQLGSARRGLIAKGVIKKVLEMNLSIEQKSDILEGVSRIGWILNKLGSDGFCYNSKGQNCDCGAKIGKIGKKYQGECVFI